MRDVPGRLVAALGASILLVFGAPYVGQLRGAIQRTLPGQYRLIIGGTIAIAIAAALGAALVRIRDRRPLRYGLIVAALVGGAIYAVLTATGNAAVDVVERFHFVEYGFITFLFYRVWQDRANVAALLFPFLAGVIVGTLDEGFQWLVPARVGEWHDVLLDGAAVACGLAFSLGLHPPASLPFAVDRRTRRAIAAFVVTTVVILATFFSVVHLGYDVDGLEAGLFLSRYSADDLRDAARDRAERWRSDPPSILRRMSVEDHYLAEGLWHIQRRNEGTGLHTWKENLILERFFDPVLQYPTYSTPSGARWPPEQRANAEAQYGHDPAPYVSDANPYPIYPWNPMPFWTTVAAVMAVAVFGIMKVGPGSPPRTPARWGGGNRDR
jgi:hypothetical protein